MPLESTLNAVWASVGIFAIGAVCAAAYLRHGTARRKRFQVVCVALVVAALFPYISSTDDALRLQYLASQQQDGPGENRGHDNLMRLYEAIDAPIAGQIYRFVVAWFAVCLVAIVVLARLDRAVPQSSGRSPPLLVGK